MKWQSTVVFSFVGNWDWENYHETENCETGVIEIHNNHDWKCWLYRIIAEHQSNRFFFFWMNHRMTYRIFENSITCTETHTKVYFDVIWANLSVGNAWSVCVLIKIVNLPLATGHWGIISCQLTGSIFSLLMLLIDTFIKGTKIIFMWYNGF